MRKRAWPLGIVQIKNFYVALPYCLAVKDFVDGYSLMPNRAAVMQLRHGNPNLGDVILFIHRSVQPIRQPSTRYFPLLLLGPESCESRRVFSQSCNMRN